MGTDFNIKSSTIEKGLELAKEFLDKLVMPAVEETGLLIKEKVTYWKFKNQVKILNKAKDYCERNRIELKTVSFKLLVPLIETSALEEDELLQDKWAILLGNMVDSEQNIENHVFPYILGQISKNEYLFLEQVYLSKKERINRLTKELDDFRENRPNMEREIKDKIFDLEKKIEELEIKYKNTIPFNRDIWDLQSDKRQLQSNLRTLYYDETRIQRKMLTPEVIPEDKIEDFELSNLIRLGLVKSVQETIANSQTLEIPQRREDDSFHSGYVRVDLDIDLESNIEHIMTQLGDLFVDACTAKSKNYPQQNL